MSARPAESVTVSGITVELSNAGKVFFDDPVITKGDLVGYYRDMAARMMPKPPAASTVKQGKIPADPPRNCPGGSTGGPVSRQAGQRIRPGHKGPSMPLNDLPDDRRRCVAVGGPTRRRGSPSGRRLMKNGASSAQIPTASPEGGRHGNDPVAAR